MVQKTHKSTESLRTKISYAHEQPVGDEEGEIRPLFKGARVGAEELANDAHLSWRRGHELISRALQSRAVSERKTRTLTSSDDNEVNLRGALSFALTAVISARYFCSTTALCEALQSCSTAVSFFAQLQRGLTAARWLLSRTPRTSPKPSGTRLYFWAATTMGRNRRHHKAAAASVSDDAVSLPSQEHPRWETTNRASSETGFPVSGLFHGRPHHRGGRHHRSKSHSRSQSEMVQGLASAEAAPLVSPFPRAQGCQGAVFVDLATSPTAVLDSGNSL